MLNYLINNNLQSAELWSKKIKCYIKNLTSYYE